MFVRKHRGDAVSFGHFRTPTTRCRHIIQHIFVIWPAFTHAHIQNPLRRFTLQAREYFLLGVTTRSSVLVFVDFSFDESILNPFGTTIPTSLLWPYLPSSTPPSFPFSMDESGIDSLTSRSLLNFAKRPPEWESAGV